MFGAFLGIGEQAGFVGDILITRLPSRARACNRADGEFIVPHPHQDFRAGTHQRKAGQIEEIEERRRVHPPQRAIQRQRRQREGAGETLRQHHLKNVARQNVILRPQRHRLVIIGCNDRGQIGQGIGQRGGFGSRSGLGELAQSRVNPLARARHCRRRIASLPDRGNREQRVGEAIEHQNHRGPHKQHIGQFQRAVGSARQGFDQSDGFIAEIAHQTGERRRQAFGHRINPAGIRQRAQFGQRITIARPEGSGVYVPIAVDFRRRAARPEHQIGIKSEQAVTPAHFAAFDRFEQEIAAPRHDQPPRCAHRRVAISNDPPPYQRRTPICQRGDGDFSVFGQASGRWGHETITPALTVRQRAACATLRSLARCG